MHRFVFHLLLALTLALNAISAPLAMAQMARGSHGAHAGHVQPARANRAATEQSAHRHHGHAAKPADDADASATDPIAGGDCCEGTTCKCGCVLPPVVPYFSLLAIPHSVASAPAAIVERIAVTGSSTPPFRPPAV